MGVILKAENISKQYRLGLVGTGTIKHDLNRFWHQIRGKEDPYSKVGAVNDRSTKAKEEYVWALRDINFEVEQGEVLGIIGKNGAGKSTLLKILSRVTGPTTGSIKTKGRIASLLEVGTGFHPELTGRENIYLNGAILGMTKAEIAAKEDEIINFSGCAMYIDTPVKRYSSGMRVRLGFAVAAFLEPDILVVDEVLAVGDVEFQKKAIGKMQDISKGEGRTVLFVSHNMASVKSLCTRAIVLENGTSIFEGTAEESVSYYLNSSYQLSTTPLMERHDRKGNGKLFINDIYVETFEGVKVAELTSGEAYNIKMEFMMTEKVNPKHLVLVTQFKNENDELLTTIATDEIGVSFRAIDMPKRGMFNIEIPKLQFREGKYTMTYMVSEKQSLKSPHLIIDFLQDAFSINVIRGDYWNSGVLNLSLIHI